ncbi:AarF/UbiB family protein [Streptomyces sp. NPDC005925]|uniref:ABC1 kinase family protein n=1 Tax=Streptomyces sp. NPDC005925 TaxID=3157172 RepID=UPI0033E1E81A
MSFLIFLLSLPLWLLIIWPLVGGARRVLGVRVRTPRALLGAAVGWMVAVRVAFTALPEMRTGGQALALGIPIAGVALIATLVTVFVAELVRPSGKGWGVLGWGGALSRRLERGRRYGQITHIAVRHGLGPYLNGGRVQHPGGVERDVRLARSLRHALEEGGVVFVKLGQLLSTRPDLLSPAFITELSLLQSQVAPAESHEVEALLRAELAAAAWDVVAVDPVPLGAASIAQVHGATLRTDSGETVEVVVKVQRPGILPLLERDLDIIARVAAALERRADWARRLGVLELVRSYAVALRDELDFRIEARNIATVAAAGDATSDTVLLPSVHEELCTRRVLVMERMPGTPLGSASRLLDDCTADDRTTMARGLLASVLGQITEGGVFHADPHPGNVLLLRDCRLGLLDFGSVGRLDASLRAGLQHLLLAIDRGDAAGACDGLLEMVVRTDEIDEVRLERSVGQLIAKHCTTAGSSAGAEMFSDLFAMISAHGLAVLPEIAAVFRALATLEGTLGLIAPGFSLVDGARSIMAAKATGQFGLPQGGVDLTGELMALVPMIRRLPRRVDRIVTAVERGRLSVNVRLMADERDRRMIYDIVHLIALVCVGATSGVMSVMLLGTTNGPRVSSDITLYQVFGYNLLVISALVGLRLLYAVFRAQSR